MMEMMTEMQLTNWWTFVLAIWLGFEECYRDTFWEQRYFRSWL